MIRYLLPLLIFIQSPLLHAALLNPFKTPDGHPKWQNIANFSSGVLIILLSIVAIILFVTWRRARKYNLALEEIRANLEHRVQERTATLDQSNKLLTESNTALEREVADHVATTQMLRASESYIQNILRSMPLILVGLTRDGEITHWNRRAEQISGIKANDAIGQNLWSIYSDITVSPQHVEQALDKGETLTLRHSQPGSYHFDVIVYPLQNYDQPGVVILVDDVTKRVIAENMLVHHDKLSSMGELATAMANDINTPLQAILFDLRSFHGILESGKLLPAGTENNAINERLQQLVESASRNGHQVESVIRNLLQFARGRSEKPELANVVGVIEHSLEQASEVLTLPDTFAFDAIRVERHFEDNLPLLPCYVTELQQVFLSLFRHAYQAMADKQVDGYEPVLKLYVAKCYDALSIKIQHNGVGLSSDEQMYLFEPYLNSGDAAPDNAVAAGKRLSFAHFIITEQHQGHMAVTSDVNVGTTFHIQLELA